MKPGNFLLVLFLFCSVASFAQPVWSPEVRAQREGQWMQDSLHLTTEQMQKVSPVLLNYQQNIDLSGNAVKKNKALMQHKDAEMKAILTEEQYKKYYRREKQIRALPKPNHSGPHQPY